MTARSGDLDLLDHLLERRADLLNATTGVLLSLFAEDAKPLTAREAESWRWAIGKADELGAQLDRLTLSLYRRGYGRRLRTRLIAWPEASRPGG